LRCDYADPAMIRSDVTLRQRAAGDGRRQEMFDSPGERRGRCQMETPFPESRV
jgi:hypothetical protein